MGDVIAKRVTYEGYVQGVGFRYTATTLAGRFSVTGYVINLPDGSVEVLAEGLREHVDDFLAAIRDEMSRYIQKTNVVDVSPTNRYNRFSVKFS